MGFRTNKVPAIEERTVSGSSVSFNSAFALPLKACKVSFSATQAGSGDPSPSNPRAISGVSAIGLTANSTPVSVSLGDTRYGGYVDVVGKKLVVTYANQVYDGDENWSWSNTYVAIYKADMKPSDYDQNSKANWLRTISSIWQNGIGFGASNNKVIYVTQYALSDIGVTDINGWNTYLSEHNLEITYPLATPIEISLSDIPTLSTIIGNNSFASDSGSIDLTYKDLDIAKRGNFREVFKLPS